MTAVRPLAALLAAALLLGASAPALARAGLPRNSAMRCRCLVPMECCRKGTCSMETARPSGGAMSACEPPGAESAPPLVELLAVAPASRLAHATLPSAFAALVSAHASDELGIPPPVPPPRHTA